VGPEGTEKEKGGRGEEKCGFTLQYVTDETKCHFGLFLKIRGETKWSFFKNYFRIYGLF